MSDRLMASLCVSSYIKKKLFGNSISNLEYYLEALEDYQCCNATKPTMIRQNTSGTLGPLKLRTTF